METLLSVLFFMVALTYSSVGLGGGSSYTALMALFGINYMLIPTSSLTLNMVVTSIGILNFWRGGHVNWKLVTPFLLTSIPMSYFGGSVYLSKEVFNILLLFSLIFVALRIYIWKDLRFSLNISLRLKTVLSLTIGAILGFLAGSVGIGGGIYLVPIIIMLGLGSEKEAAAAGAIFIFANSLTGVIPRIQRDAFDLEFILPLIIAVALGGYLGSHIGALRFKPRTVQKVLGVVILIAVGFLTNEVL